MSEQSQADKASDPRSFGFWRIAATDPHRVAVIDDDGTEISFGQLLGTARAIGRGFRQLGLRRGDGVAVVLPNVPEFFAVLLAAQESGLYFTPVNSHLAAPEIEHVIVDSEARVVVVHEDLGDVCAAAVEGCDYPLERRFAVGAVDSFRPIGELLLEGDDSRSPLLDRSPGQLMMYTSGTTGKPKGVRRPLPEGDPDDVYGEQAWITSRGFRVPLGNTAHLVCGPLYHAGPFIGAVNSIHVGNTVVVMKKWAPQRCLELIDRYRVASAQMVPTMFHRLLALPPGERERHDVSSLRSVMHAGAPCPVDVKKRLMEWWGPVVYETYGGTEAAATIALPERWLEKPGTVGKAIHGVKLHILDDDGEPVPTGVPGNVYIETASPPPEYFKDPDKTRQIRNGRRITLGDIGYLDEDGYLFLCDRKIDMIISGGVNIYPAEVEAALLADPRIADVVVLGVPDDEWGEAVKALVELAAGVAPSDEAADDIIAVCQTRIARFKCPRSVDFVDELPRLPNGKVEKRRLREVYWAGREAAI